MDAKQTRSKQELTERISNVNKAYSAFTALQEVGITISNPSNDESIFCPFHDNKNTTAARYYGSDQTVTPHVYCFVCKQRWESVAIFAKSKRIKFIEALQKLEKRFGIIPRAYKEQDNNIESHDKKFGQRSSQWDDVERSIKIMESKLIRHRTQLGFLNYTRYNYILNLIEYDYKKKIKPADDIVAGLINFGVKIDEIVSQESDILHDL